MHAAERLKEYSNVMTTGQDFVTKRIFVVSNIAIASAVNREQFQKIRLSATWIIIIQAAGKTKAVEDQDPSYKHLLCKILFFK